MTLAGMPTSAKPKVGGARDTARPACNRLTHEVELVLVRVGLHLTADVCGCLVGVPEVDPGPDPRLHHLIGHIREVAVELLLSRETAAREEERHLVRPEERPERGHRRACDRRMTG